MNRRQAKKNFKKKHGMNPEQVAKIINQFDWGKFADALANAISQLPKAIEKYIEDNPEVIERLKKENGHDNP